DLPIQLRMNVSPSWWEGTPRNVRGGASGEQLVRDAYKGTRGNLGQFFEPPGTSAPPTEATDAMRGLYTTPAARQPKLREIE
ncbi:MAG TPA: hypothetical protein VL992_15030, partial [Tepidisphaeraceae bacterium]|nr:hypothetical protein [Tepidisphaeraceae bacterium]